MTIKELKFLEKKVKERPKEWREGQAWFNYVNYYVTKIEIKIRMTKYDSFNNDSIIPELKKHLLNSKDGIRVDECLKEMKDEFSNIIDEIKELQKLKDGK